MYKELINSIKKYDYITIFRHQRPDGDCTFSQFALKEFIKINFKNKKVKCVSNDTYDVFDIHEKVNDLFIKNSLAIILDVSNIDRTDDTRFLTAKERFIIDHHPGNPTHAENKIVDTEVSATCELLAKIFYSKEFSKFLINKRICKYLYCGILTDSNSFSTSNTTSDTLMYASRLMKDGKLKGSDLNEYVFNVSYDEFNNVSKFRNYLKIDRGVAYCVLSGNDLKKLDLSFEVVKNNVNEFSKIKEVKIWAVFAYNKKSRFYEGSIRSRRKYIINDLCNKYNGGGHKNACGVKKMTPQLIDSFINECIDIVNE